MSLLLVMNVIWHVTTLALVTVGLAVIFGQLKIMNMAHGEFVMIGAYSAVITSAIGLPEFMQLPVCLLTSGTAAFLIEYFVARHFYGRIAGGLLATWAIGILMRETIIVFFGSNFQHVSLPIEGTTQFLGGEYPTYRLVIIGFIILFFIGMYFWHRHSRIGLKIRAMMANTNLAAAIGTNVPVLSRNAFIFGCIITSFSGWLLAPTTRVDPYMGLDYLVRSFFALIVGGFGSIEGTLVGAGTIAGGQSIVSALTNPTSGYIFVLILSILFLWRRPHGIINPH